MVLSTSDDGRYNALTIGRFLLEACEWRTDCRPTATNADSLDYSRYVGQFEVKSNSSSPPSKIDIVRSETGSSFRLSGPERSNRLNIAAWIRGTIAAIGSYILRKIKWCYRNIFTQSAQRNRSDPPPRQQSHFLYESFRSRAKTNPMMRNGADGRFFVVSAQQYNAELRGSKKGVLFGV